MKQTLLVFFISLCSVAFAQKGGISGKVIDNETKEPLVGASVIIQNSNAGTVTDLEGNYVIKNVAAGEYDLAIKYMGYNDITQKIVVADGQTVTVPDILATSSSIGLKEVEVFANVVTADRKTPIAVSDVTDIELDEQLGGLQTPELFNAAPGVYATPGDGSYGDAYINIRGFGQQELLFMLNGVPMNDMENGIMYWTNFAGVSEVTRGMQIQRGLGASKLGVNSVGGTFNIITQPSERRKGGNIEVSMANNSTYNNRYKLTLNSGLLKGGWAFTFQGLRTTGTGIRPGTFVDSYNYFLTASKKINDNHSLLFTVFGSPTNRGRAYSSNTATYNQYGSLYYNYAVGIYRGQQYNVSQNYSHVPTATLMHLWTINNKMTLNTSVYASIARAYGTSILGGVGTSTTYPTTHDGLYDLDSLARINSGKYATETTIQNPYGYSAPVEGYQSKYILESRYNNHNWYGIITNLNWQVSPTTNLILGLDARDYKASHFARVKDLFNGDFWLDVGKYTGEDNNRLTPNRIARVGDKIDFNYDGNVRWGSVFAQVEKTFRNFNVFASFNGSQTQMWRVGNWWNGVQDVSSSGTIYYDYRYNSLGQSDKRVFTNYNAKAGLNYNISGRHSVFVNGGKFTRAPFMANALAVPEYGNEFILNLRNEDIQAAEAGYHYRTGKLKVNLDVYYVEWHNKGFLNTSSSNTDFTNPVTGQRQAITGIAARHEGIELDIKYQPIPSLQLSGMFSKGNYEWMNNGTATFNDESGAALKTVQIYTKGLKVGNTAQTTAFIGARYSGFQNMAIGFRWNYFGDLYEQFDPSQRISGYLPVRKLPDYTLLDVYGNYNFKMGDLRARAGVNVHNLLNAHVIRRSNELYNHQEVYSFPTNYVGSLTIYF